MIKICANIPFSCVYIVDIGTAGKQTDQETMDRTYLLYKYPYKEQCVSSNSHWPPWCEDDTGEESTHKNVSSLYTWQKTWSFLFSILNNNLL